MMPQNAPAPKKPGQVLAVQIIFWIQLGLGLCIGGLAALGGAAVGSLSDAELADAGVSTSDVPLIMTAAIVTIISSLVAGYLAFMVPSRKKWVRTAGLILVAVTLAGNIVSVLIQPGASSFVSFVLPIVLIVLLVSRPAKEWFTE
ncbi:hypothetical protein AB0I28_25480 [Phytomonospora sp. NPDC050363]|uniref:hypothetical protein n=1 Tax=Phytomonospora sp. NPDC050363 TaxID=3155642 RepID=UPI0033C014D2